jgi:hypothetical protein
MLHNQKWQQRHPSSFFRVLKPKEDESVAEYYLRLDDRMKVIYAVGYWGLFTLVALFTKTTFWFYVINTGLAVFYYFFMRSNMRKDKYYKIYFDLNSWLHIITVNIVWATFTPAVADRSLWQVMWPVLAAFVFFFSLNRILEWRMDVGLKKFEREMDDYREELRVKREQRNEAESNS